MTRASGEHRARRAVVRALCIAAAMAAAVISTNAFAQGTGAQSNSSGNATSVTSDSTTATGSTGRTDSPTGRDATRNRSRIGTKPSGEYVPRTGSSAHRDKHGNVVNDRSTGGSPQGRERPPASPPNIPATQP